MSLFAANSLPEFLDVMLYFFTAILVNNKFRVWIQTLHKPAEVSHLGAEITFGSVPTGLAPGDVLSLGEQVACANESSEMGWCSVEDEDELRGTRQGSCAQFAGEPHLFCGSPVGYGIRGTPTREHSSPRSL